MRIKKGSIKFSSSTSEEVKQIITLILQKEVNNRPSFEQIYDTAFFKKHHKPDDKKHEENLNINEFNSSQNFKKYQLNQTSLKSKKFEKPHVTVTENLRKEKTSEKFNSYTQVSKDTQININKTYDYQSSFKKTNSKDINETSVLENAHSFNTLEKKNSGISDTKKLETQYTNNTESSISTKPKK